MLTYITISDVTICIHIPWRKIGKKKPASISRQGSLKINTLSMAIRIKVRPERVM